MSLEVQKQLLQGHINRMYDEGDVDDLFDKFKVYGSVEKASELLKQVELYCLEVNREISKLESYSKLAKINFLEATKIARSIKARSIWIGAQHVTKASFFVIDDCLGFQEESYSQAVDGLRNDFEYTKKKFETYLKMVSKYVRMMCDASMMTGTRTQQYGNEEPDETQHSLVDMMVSEVIEKEKQEKTQKK